MGIEMKREKVVDNVFLFYLLANVILQQLMTVINI